MGSIPLPVGTGLILFSEFHGGSRALAEHHSRISSIEAAAHIMVDIVLAGFAGGGCFFFHNMPSIGVVTVASIIWCCHFVVNIVIVGKVVLKCCH